MVSGRPLRVAIFGRGRMAREVAELAPERAVEVTGMLGRERGAASAELLAGADVAIDFSVADAVDANVDLCLEHACPVVVGTTGWYERLPELQARVGERGGALLWAPNFSVGAALLERLCAHAGTLLRGMAGLDVHLVETHHAAKRDAPSGTALALRAALDAEGVGEVPISSVRVGSVPGVHELLIDGAYEQVTLRHEARSRRVFADGAIRAAAWLPGRTGVFTMKDILTLETP